MAVSEMIKERVSEAMEAFSKVFSGSQFEVRIRSLNREGGDREFLLKMNGETLVCVHVKRDSYKMYMKKDELFYASDNKDRYKRLKEDPFITLNSIDECIEEVQSALAKYVNRF